MKRLAEITGQHSDDNLFELIVSSFRNKITMWSYFVDWNRVWESIKEIEVELNILNVLIGKEDIEEQVSALIMKQPTIVKAFPILLACRDKSFEILTDIHNLISVKYDFSVKTPTNEQADHLAKFVVSSGLGDILKDRKIKSIYDYVVGVEVGLGSNGRKNRGGTAMETLVDNQLKLMKEKADFEYITQATSSSIESKLGIKVDMDKSSRIIDFAIKKGDKLYLIEVNFYGGGGSKLKSTATEYIEMYNRYHSKGIEFIWITDGAGWHSTLRPLREYFDKTDYLLSLSMLKSGVLTQIISQ